MSMIRFLLFIAVMASIGGAFTVASMTSKSVGAVGANISADTMTPGVAAQGQPTCSLSPSSAVRPAGLTHSVTVNTGIPSVKVQFFVSAGPNFGVVGPRTADLNGQATFSYTSNGEPGTDTITVSGSTGDPANPQFSCSATVTWQAGGGGPVACSLTPSSATKPAGQSHMVSAFVTNNGAGVSGATVNFSVTSGPNAGMAGSRTTDFRGIAEFIYNSNGQPGADTIEARGSAGGSSFSATATVIWEGPGGGTRVAISLTPSSAVRSVDEAHTVTATATNNGSPVSGLAVNFNVTSGPDAGRTGSGVTDSSGRAAFTYNNVNRQPGADTIEARGTFNGVPISAMAAVTWQSAGVACSLAPASANRQVGETHALTVTVTSNGSPASGATVNFNVTNGPNIGRSDAAAVNASGQASFVYNSNGQPGPDRIEASGAFNGSAFSCSAAVTWVVAGSPPVSSSLEPQDAVEVIGGTHTVKITLTQGGVNPGAGIPVNFRVISGPNSGKTATDTTNINGRAPFTYTSNGKTGVDIIEATGSANGSPFSSRATVTWKTPEGFVGFLDPARASRRVGDTHTVKAKVLRRGVPAPDIFISFSILSGPNSGRSASAKTDSNGEADFTYTSNRKPGVDNIDAFGGIPGAGLDGIFSIGRASVVWEPDIGQPVDCALDPSSAVAAVNGAHTVRATLRQSGVGVGAGVSVTFRVVSGPNAGKTDSAKTNANGHATFTYTSNGKRGLDTIEAAGLFSDIPFSGQATVLWNQVRTCSLDPPFATRQINATHTVTLTAMAGKQPIEGVTVSFAVIDGPNAVAANNRTSITDIQGKATFSYRSNGVEGVDLIRVQSSDNSFSCNADVFWTVTETQSSRPPVKR